MIYRVIVDVSNAEVDRVFDYSSDFDVEVGSRVLVPFGKRTIEGFVVGTKEKTDIETKKIIRKLDAFTPIIPEMIELSAYLKENNNLRYADTLRLCIPSKLRGGKVKELTRGFLKLDVDKEIAKTMIRKNSPNQLAIIESIKGEGEFETVLAAEFGAGSVKALIDKGILHKEIVTVNLVPLKGMVADKKNVVLSDEQNAAVERIIDSNKPCVLHGVTGSGKTEVYMAAIERILKRGKTAIMLVPEISLTPQMLGVFRRRFGEGVALLHSGMSDGERYDEWRKLLTGEAKVALGARSAIFAPLKNVGIIVIDEEHDSSYVSESNPRYHTHDIAEFRRKYNGAKLVLGSATPSLDTYYKAIKGEYELITLPGRANGKAMPDMDIVDMRREIREGNNNIFSRKLLAELDKTLKDGNQAMIYINRRGFASFVRCKKCGYVPMCTDCEVSLTYHKEDNLLKCHYCGKQFYNLDACPSCGNENLSLGRIGTETVMEKLSEIFPKARLLRLDNDTASGKDSSAQILSAFARKEADILVGTQMIVKGHDFAGVTLVGVLDADLSLYGSDYRSNETTFQQITQVAGRAGRDEKEGKVVIQTYNPNHYVFRFARKYDYRGFFEKENNIRETTSFPPFSKIARVLVKGENEEKTLVAAREEYEIMRSIKAEHPQLFRVQAMRAPIKKISNEYRFQIVVWIKEEAEKEVLPLVYKAADRITGKGVTAFVEINPTNMR
ncbi:MAG: primosomal protein N' [Christensenellales bacterium]